MLVDGILVVGGNAQPAQALFLPAFGEGDQRRGRFPLRAQRTAPIVVAGCRQRLANGVRSEEHTSELQSHHDLVCRLLLEKKKKKINQPNLYNKKNKQN